jgi:hypothetical protein
MTERNKGQDWANLVLAVLLFISPWVIGFSGDKMAAWNAWVVGVIIAVLAIAALSAFAVWEEWINLLLGLWLIISPWVLGYAPDMGARWTAVILGIIAALISASAVWSYQHNTHAHA